MDYSHSKENVFFCDSYALEIYQSAAVFFFGN